MCQPAPVIDRYGADVAEHFGIPYVFNQPGPGGVFLGSVGDQAHQSHRSSHNCAPMQEEPVNGVSYSPNFAHAWDARPATKAIGEAMRLATLRDPRCRYVIFDNVGTKPNGERWTTDHPTYHVSMLPGTHDDTRPFFGDKEPFTVDQFKQIMAELKAIDARLDRIEAVPEGKVAKADRQRLKDIHNWVKAIHSKVGA